MCNNPPIWQFLIRGKSVRGSATIYTLAPALDLNQLRLSRIPPIQLSLSILILAPILALPAAKKQRPTYLEENRVLFRWTGRSAESNFPDSKFPFVDPFASLVSRHGLGT
jgi:hypothetical protein